MGIIDRFKKKYNRSAKDRTEIHVFLAFVVIPFIGMGSFAIFVFTQMV